jgi:gamma-glutamyltranspeptidase/glutathione hydrolase
MPTPRRSKRTKTHHEPNKEQPAEVTMSSEPTLDSHNVYQHPEPRFVHFSSRRSVVHSTKGIVSCTQPLAAAAGIEILRKGGNAAV